MEGKDVNSTPVQEKIETAPTPSSPAMPATKSGYGKKGGWTKWLLIYLIIAVVIYGLIWFFFMRDTGTTSSIY